MKPCTRCHLEPRRSPSQRLCKLCHAKDMVERRKQARALLGALLASVARGTHDVEQLLEADRRRKISATKLQRNRARRLSALDEGRTLDQGKAVL